jgi:hypothetical protein
MANNRTEEQIVMTIAERMSMLTYNDNVNPAVDVGWIPIRIHRTRDPNTEAPKADTR